MDNHRVTTTNSDSKKSSKPVMEKRRRARINASLAELKSLLLDAIKMEGTRHSKMEKADILELAVRHLKDVQNHPFLTVTNPSSSVLSKYVMGFQACTAEVSKYFSHGDYEDFTLKSKLLNHLADCLAGGDDLSNSSEITSSTLSTPSTSLTDYNKYETTSSFIPSLSVSTDFNQNIISSGDDDIEDRMATNQSLVSSSNQKISNPSTSSSLSPPATPLSSSLLSSTVSSHFNPHQLGNSASVIHGNSRVDDKEVSRLNKREKSLQRESIIVTSKDDDENDNSFNDTDDDDDDNGTPIRDTRNKAGNMNTQHDSNNNTALETETKIHNPTQLTTQPSQYINGPTFASISQKPQQMFFQKLSENQHYLQKQSTQQNQTQETERLQQQHLAGINALPFLGQDIRLLSAQPNTNEIALVLPANIISPNGSFQKLYIPLIQPQTFQNSATTLVAPQIIQSNPIPSIQIQPIQQAALPSILQQVPPKQMTTEMQVGKIIIPETSHNQEIVTSTDTRQKSPMQQLIPTTDSNHVIDLKKTQGSCETQTHLHAANYSGKDFSLPNLGQSGSLQYPLITTSENGNNYVKASFAHHPSTDTSVLHSLEPFNTNSSVPQHLDIIEKRVQLNQMSQPGHCITENKNKEVNGDAPINYHVDTNQTFLPSSKNVQNRDINNQPISQNFLHNPSTTPKSIDNTLDPSLYVITTSPSEKNNNCNPLRIELKHNNSPYYNTMATTLPIPIFSSNPQPTTIDNKRPHSPSTTKTHKRFHPDCTQSKDEVYSVNGLDLSVPWAKQENDRVSLSGHKSFVHGPGIKRASPMMIGGGGDDTCPLTEIETRQKDTPTSAKNNNLCKGSFFRPW